MRIAQKGPRRIDDWQQNGVGRKESFIIAIFLSASLWMVQSRCPLFCTKMGTQVHRVPKHLLTSCIAMSVTIFNGKPYGNTHLLKATQATVVAVILVLFTACVRFGYLSVIVTVCWYYLLFLGSGPKISITTNSNGLVAGKTL